MRSLLDGGHFDVVHAHLTYAEGAAVLTRRRHRGKVISTRHIATRRGGSLGGRVLAGRIERGIDHELAISDFVAAAVGLERDRVLHNGVRRNELMWSEESRAVVVAHRLEVEKDTLTALKAWSLSELADHGWRLIIAGSGSEAEELHTVVSTESIRGGEFLGHVDDMNALWARTGILLATATAEPLGLTVLEAMAAGIPTVTSASGGHLETASTIDGHMSFAPRDAKNASVCLRHLAFDSDLRRRLGRAGQEAQRAQFDVNRHVDRLVEIYDSVAGATDG